MHMRPQRSLCLSIATLLLVTTGFVHSVSALAQTPLAAAVANNRVLPATPAKVDLDALIRVESKTIGSDGVTRTSLYEETFMRRGEQIWTQRIRPKQTTAHNHDKEGHAGHKHLDPFEGGRLISLEDGKPQMRLISASEKRVVSVPSVEFGNLGFDGSWERAYYLVTQLEFKSFKPATRVSNVSDAKWFEKKGEVNESILWDNNRKVPLVIESTNRQGSQWRRITVIPRKELTAVVPWGPQLVKNFDQMLYSDFLD
jgi:hypothetical protein